VHTLEIHLLDLFTRRLVGAARILVVGQFAAEYEPSFLDPDEPR